jgi:hypothetical protein
MDYAGSSLFIGAGATLTTDLWAIARGRLFGIPAPDWGLVGRWLGHMARGRFRHERIATAEPVRGERVIGWTAHYLIGITFAGGLLAICGLAWARQPTLAPALAFGIATVAAPFLLMQPGMGAGIAASRTPRPNSARLQSLLTHAVFGLGLYAAGLVLKLLLGE